MKRKSEINLFLEQFYKIIYVDFGIRELNDNLKNWYKLSWDEFKEELLKMKVKASQNFYNDWEYFFNLHKNRVLQAMN